MATEAKPCSHPHVLLFPFPAQGHVSPMLKLAELLSSAGGDLHVTFVNTENIHARFLQRSPGAFHRLSSRPNFRFREISDGLPEEDPRSILEFLKLEDSLRSRSRERFRQLLTPSSHVDKWPPVTCVITDGMIRMAFEVSNECLIPVMIVRTSSPESVWAYYSMPELIRTGNLPFPEEADMDELIQGVGELEDLNLRRRDLPGLLRHIKSVDDPMLQYLISMGRSLPRARALILNSTENLGSRSLPRIRSVCPVTYTIGPLQLMQETLIGGANSDEQSAAKNVSLWKEDRSCMAWLDRQPDKSVVYVSFGSVTVMSTDAFVEFRHVLDDSGYRFLWVVRPDMVQGKVEGQVSDKSCIVEWAPQEEVLSHRAVGCFVTHSGWNSTLESIVAGVPMICWPFFADQQTNSRLVSEVLKVGIDMKDVCERSVTKMMIRRAMDGEEAEVLRERAREVAREVRMSAVEGGSSYENFRMLIEHIKSLSQPTVQG